MIEGRGPDDEAYLGGGEWQVDIAGTRYPAVVSMKPLYDPAMRRIRI
jgi:hypothetical protein